MLFHLDSLTETIGLSDKFKNMRLVCEPIQKRSCHNLVLECVIMPFSLIVLLVEAILEAA